MFRVPSFPRPSLILAFFVLALIFFCAFVIVKEEFMLTNIMKQLVVVEAHHSNNVSFLPDESIGNLTDKNRPRNSTCLIGIRI